MLENVLYPALRSVIAFLLLLTMTRLIGRKTISQLTFFDFTVGITLGSVTASLAIGQQTTPYAAATVLISLSLLAIASGYLYIHSFKGRKLMDSEPVVVIDKGRIVDRNMRRVRLNINDLTTLLREKDVFNMADVEFALLETDGKLSVLPKSAKQPLTPSDLNISTNYKGLTADVIIDGNIMEENLRSTGKSREWLVQELKKQGISDVQQIFYAGLDSSGTLYTSKKRDEAEKHGQYGID